MYKSKQETGAARRWLREPLLHFLVMGGLLFAVYAWRNRGATEETAAPVSNEIHLGEGDLKWLSETWAKQWERQPTQEEMRKLIAAYLKERLMAREAQSLGLDKNDTIIRRRLAQKMDFIVQDATHIADPTEEQLKAFYESHLKQFQKDARISFTQIYFNSSKRKDAAADAKEALEKLGDSATVPEGMGDWLMVKSEFDDAPRRVVRSQLGATFTDAVFEVKPGAWTGPIESGFGLHLVRVASITPAEQQPFDDVRAEVELAWQEQQERESRANYFATLLEKYQVVMDAPAQAVVGRVSDLVKVDDSNATN